MPGKPFRSKLLPYYNDIKAWRSERLTWREIAEKLTAIGVATQSHSVHEFFKRQMKETEVLGFPTQHQSVVQPSIAPVPLPQTKQSQPPDSKQTVVDEDKLLGLTNESQAKPIFKVRVPQSDLKFPPKT